MKNFYTTIVALIFIGAASAFGANPAPDLPSKMELEKELSLYYQEAAVKVLKAMDPSRQYSALVQVTIGNNAKWDELRPTVSELDYLPGTVRRNAENDVQKRFRVSLALPQKRSVLVLLPEDADDSIQENAKTWIRKELRMGQDETVDFATQIAEKEQKKAGEEKFYGSKLYWLSLIIALTFLAALIIVMIARFKNARPAPAKKEKKDPGEAEEKPPGSPLQNFMQKFKQGLDKDDPSDAEKGAAEPAELPPSVKLELAAIERICLHDPEIASAAFGILVSRADHLPHAAGIVQAFGIERALSLLPKMTGHSWSQVGDAITASEDAEGLSLEDAVHFRKAFTAEVARMQRSKEQVRMLPHLETLGAAEIARRIRTFGPQRGAVALAALSESIISGVVPKMSGNEVANLLSSLMATNSAKMSDLEQMDRDEVGGGGQDQVIEIESARKCALVLSTLSASEEFNIFDRLVASRGDHFYSEIAPYRLFPMHLHFVQPQAIAEVMQTRELDDIKKLMGAAPPNLHEKLLGVMSERQRAIVEGADGSEADPEALRSFLADLHNKQFLGQPHKVAETFGSRKVA